MEGAIYHETVNELLLGHGLASICLNRQVKNGRNTGGGVAVIARKSRVNMKEFKIQKNGCEVIAVRGKIVDCTRPLFVIGTYLLPSIRKPTLDKYCAVIRDAINKIKMSERNPLIVLDGDFNHLDVSSALQDFLDIQQAPSSPTRNGERLDLIYSNESSMCKICPAIENENGGSLVHSVLQAVMSFPHKHSFEWVTYRMREMTKKNHEKFAKDYCSIDWEALLENVFDPSEMTTLMHERVGKLTDLCFPWHSRKIRSTDVPWITDEVRRAICRRKRCYKKHKRSAKWHLIKAETDQLIFASKKEYLSLIHI